MNFCLQSAPDASTVPTVEARHRFDYQRCMLNARIWSGKLIYGHCGPRTIRTGPHTLVKFGRSVDEAEADAMRFIAKNTSVPVPKVYSVRKYGGITYIEMEYIRGQEVTYVWHGMSTTARKVLLDDLESYVRQIRNLSPPSPGIVASASGGRCRDHRFGIRPAGPFATHDEFHRFLRLGDDLWQWEDNYDIVVKSHTKSYVSKFTHGDLAPRNVMVHKGRISAIIDWDCAGWRPEYWEVTKAHFASAGTPDEWLACLKHATGDLYETQLRAEMKLWTAAESPSCPPRYLDEMYPKPHSTA
ncbi:kinase-like domain-containing protein [Mycena sp. CBHHK59/15]|nr:kinase-like domain-containing protein [Mycena sp. CBHHK59/15]